MVRKVVVTTGCRLHFTLIDMNADLGRVDGGIGVALRKPGWKVEITRSKRWDVDPLAKEVVELVKERMGPKGRFKVRVKGSIPAHVGLGSRTQLSLAIVSGIASFGKGDVSPRTLAGYVDRGGTSGIGVTAFEKGGLILDGGHKYHEKGGFLPSRYSKAGPPPILATYQVPTNWYFVVGVPSGRLFYGKEEARAFKDHTPIPRKDVGAVARLVLLKLLPALVEKDIGTFGHSIRMIQNLGFKRIENRLQGDHNQKFQEYIRRRKGAHGAGLSSMGPACFTVVEGKEEASRIAASMKRYLKDKDGGSVFFSKAAPRGASIKVT